MNHKTKLRGQLKWTLGATDTYRTTGDRSGLVSRLVSARWSLGASSFTSSIASSLVVPAAAGSSRVTKTRNVKVTL